ncbi:MAG: hypothetical protein JWM59_2148 [Verrucomicrobiales bacterium]|nr:hypothetical protein [Verrucomicrobiales bacterium]
MRIKVSVSEQRLYLLKNTGECLKAYLISTSGFGLGSEPDSHFTPLGRFRIVQKIGHGAPPGTIFRSRQAVGLWEEGQESAEDYVLTRILWLDGMEEGNANTFSRYIYIHGTNQEGRLGTPASHGCIRMANADVIELFDTVELGTEVEIGDVTAAPAGLREFV